MYENEAQSEPPLQILLMRHHRHRPTILSDCLIVISIKGSFSNFVGVNENPILIMCGYDGENNATELPHSFFMFWLT
ncbi:hypothetical protein SNOG_13547 [Parastagonospora nodorum SN15]|uniref:Uncharacterized protein n=1 Tax=Phaeosphaeria nodorum (strain SN15 / ATCC MYA-4574 / FGSC 10173) TaxID=321614 RepID=Q0U3W7_PHANO|nr:hypothetical protein SNOG_13547 [Parastagonospora nodorum SN15]EAT78994.1 hypothetical protein SNOG_13547 [Parastagonospora nodorum SN15]